ncbi:Hypothetical protein KVN_LOCUS388 [uncultured virus]|nr:Hypothetical protein KVN_LOCUS388 [uncultured virus]
MIHNRNGFLDNQLSQYDFDNIDEAINFENKKIEDYVQKIKQFQNELYKLYAIKKEGYNSISEYNSFLKIKKYIDEELMPIANEFSIHVDDNLFEEKNLTNFIQKIETIYAKEKCLQYASENNINHSTNFDNWFDVCNLIICVHKHYNNKILNGQIFNGCQNISDYFGKQNCKWIYNSIECSCGNYKGFYWELDGIDWIKDIRLDSKLPLGFQARLW